jgi:hypothetical protein
VSPTEYEGRLIYDACANALNNLDDYDFEHRAIEYIIKLKSNFDYEYSLFIPDSLELTTGEAEILSDVLSGYYNVVATDKDLRKDVYGLYADIAINLEAPVSNGEYFE